MNLLPWFTIVNWSIGPFWEYVVGNGIVRISRFPFEDVEVCVIVTFPGLKFVISEFIVTIEVFILIIPVAFDDVEVCDIVTLPSVKVDGRGDVVIVTKAEFGSFNKVLLNVR